MADKEKNILLKIKAEDQTSGTLNKFKGSIKAAFSIAAVGLFVKAIDSAVDSVKEMAQRAGDLQEVSAGFARNFGKQTDALKKLQDASAGMIDNYDLMRIASKSANMQVTTDVTKLGKVMQTAQILSDEMGTDFQDTYEQLVEGIGKGSDRMLKALGIIVPQALSEAMTKMSDTQKTAALLNYVIEQGVSMAAQYGDANLSISDKLLILQSTFQNLKDSITLALAPVFDEGLNSILRWVKTLQEVAPEGIDKIQSKLEGEDGLIGTLMNLVSNTDMTDDQFKTLVEGVWKEFVDALTKDGGIIDSINATAKEFSEFIKSGDAETMITQFKNVMTAADAVAKAILGINSAFLAVSALWNTNSNKLATINTGIGNKISAKELIATGKNIIPQENVNNVTQLNTNLSAKYGLTKATGGMASGWTMAGENGPEIVKLPSGSHVYNNEDSKGMIGSGITININAPTYGINDLRNSILEAVNEATAKQNRLANYNLL